MLTIEKISPGTHANIHHCTELTPQKTQSKYTSTRTHKAQHKCAEMVAGVTLVFVGENGVRLASHIVSATPPPPSLAAAAARSQQQTATMPLM